MDEVIRFYPEVVHPMNPFIINEIDSEIERLQAARKLLAGNSGAAASAKATKRAGRAASFDFGVNTAKAPRRRLSPEARERIRQAQLKRWAATKQSSKSTPSKKSSAKATKKARPAKGQSSLTSNGQSSKAEK
jgi:hypothetical protein